MAAIVVVTVVTVVAVAAVTIVAVVAVTVAVTVAYLLDRVPNSDKLSTIQTLDR